MPRPQFWVALGLAIAVAAGGYYASITVGNPSHFPRAGAVIVVIGAITAASNTLQAGSGIFAAVSQLFSRQRRPSATLGLALMVVGTLIWAFGDLVVS